MPLNVEVEGIDEAIVKLKELDTKASEKIKKQTTKSALKIEAKAKRLAPVDTGRLRASLQTRFSNAGLSATILSDVKYAPYVEFGRKPGKPPPTSALEGWARRHGMSELAYVIARSIGRKGVQEQPFLRPAFESEKNNYIRKVKQALNNLEG